jgi:hypothetical protein
VRFGTSKALIEPLLSAFVAFEAKRLSNREPALVNGVNPVSIHTAPKHSKIRERVFALTSFLQVCDETVEKVSLTEKCFLIFCL